LHAAIVFKKHGNKRLKTRLAGHRHAELLRAWCEYGTIMCMRESCCKNSNANKKIYRSANLGKTQ